MTELIDTNNGKQIEYDSILVEPKKLSIFGSDLSLKIISELAKKPACAMDLSRRLDQHEQKIYYHLRKLENAGIIKQIRTEKRHSMTAKIYGVVSPVVSTKIHTNGGHSIEEKSMMPPPKMKKLLTPFIKDGKLNALLILGDPYEHGEHDAPARSSVHTFDFAVMMGRFLKELKFPHYKLDVDIREEDLKNNLIVFNSSKANTVIQKLNQYMPIYFDNKRGWQIVSTFSGKTYTDPRIGLIAKFDNPFCEGKKVLVISGLRTRGIHSSIIAITQQLNKLMEGISERDDLFRVVEGFDKDGDRVIDTVRFLE